MVLPHSLFEKCGITGARQEAPKQSTNHCNVQRVVTTGTAHHDNANRRNQKPMQHTARPVQSSPVLSYRQFTSPSFGGQMKWKQPVHGKSHRRLKFTTGRLDQ